MMNGRLQQTITIKVKTAPILYTNLNLMNKHVIIAYYYIKPQ